MKKTILITEDQFNTLKNTFRLGTKGGYFHVNEDVVDEVDSDDVDLSSFEPHKNLVDSLWGEDGKLDSRVRLRLLDIADDFIEFLGFEDLKPVDIRLTGSICNYNWSKQSDIDVHIVYNFKDIDSDLELVEEYVDSKKNEWNNMHDELTIYGFDVEFYVEDYSQVDVSAGEYSLNKNEWINIPDKSKMRLKDMNTIKDLSAKIMTLIDDYYDLFFCCEDDSYNLEYIDSELEELRVFLKNLRSQQLDAGGEMAVGNIVYKVLRRTGYLDTLYELQNKIYDKINSIE